MSAQISPINDPKGEDYPFPEAGPSVTRFKSSIWTFGLSALLFAVIDRMVALFADGYVTAIELTHLFILGLLFMGWLYLQPESTPASGTIKDLLDYQKDPAFQETYLSTIQPRIDKQQADHMIRQEYVLPFPYLCQIYHLLNLKHLENIHSFSLNNLRIVKVSDFQPTLIGGMIKFQTVLDSPFNPLRIWRQPVVEVELSLHTPYTVELNIPVYNDKRIIVIFNAFPISSNEHKFFIDIYSNLEWPKPLLQILLHFASCLTLFEDIPYLHKLAERNLSRLTGSGKISNHETMLLFKRFTELYGSAAKSLPQTVEAIA
jgi:hypothetical protein